MLPFSQSHRRQCAHKAVGRHSHFNAHWKLDFSSCPRCARSEWGGGRQLAQHLMCSNGLTDKGIV